MPDFLSLGISKEIVSKLNDNGVVIPTPIQEKAIPFIMDGKDLIAQAQTGTGKTLAFILPILEKINPNASYTTALIVTPTRELAIQITDEVNKLILGLEGVNVLAVYGGQDVEKQLKKLKKNMQIVVGTPGRLLDHINRGTLKLSKVSNLVLDEADQMLHIGFLNEVEKIIRETPDNKQSMLFSATIPDEIKTLAKKYMNKPEYIQIEKTQGPAENVKQVAIYTIDRAKQATLIQLIETYRPYLAVIFCRTKRRVSKLYEVLKSTGLHCDELHGDLSQAKREQVMKRFREAEIQLLIATDVAARGLDVDGVTHVFNYDIPQDSESYIHRIGRTGRAGTKGIAITLYSSKDRPLLDMIEKELNLRVHKQNQVKTGSKQEQTDSNHRKSTQLQGIRERKQVKSRKLNEYHDRNMVSKGKKRGNSKDTSMNLDNSTSRSSDKKGMKSNDSYKKETKQQTFQHKSPQKNKKEKTTIVKTGRKGSTSRQRKK